MFHVKDGLYFTRDLHESSAEKGCVTIIQTTDGKEPCFPTPPDFPAEFGRVKGNIAYQVKIDEGSWCSIVLSMTEFSERQGDWHAWMRHHKGEEDLLAGKRGGY